MLFVIVVGGLDILTNSPEKHTLAVYPRFFSSQAQEPANLC